MQIRHSWFIGVALVLGSASLLAQKAPSSSFTISRMEARLYFPETGAFSEDMLAAPRLSLWNTIIGAGWAEQPSNATLVQVEVEGDPALSTRGLFVDLQVSDARNAKVLLNRKLEVIPSERRTRKLAFWLYDTGCVPLVLRASLVGQSDPATTVKRIPFECGE